MVRRVGGKGLWVACWLLLASGALPAAAADTPISYEFQLSSVGIEGTPFGLQAPPVAPLVGTLEVLPPEGTSSIASLAHFSLTIGDTTWTEADVTHSKVSLRGGEIQWRDSVLRAIKGSPPVKIVLGRYVNAATDERDGTETLSLASISCRRCEPRP